MDETFHSNKKIGSNQIKSNVKQLIVKRLWIGIFIWYVYFSHSAKGETFKANVVFFHGKTFDERTAYPVQDALPIFSHPKFDRNKKSTMYVHGYVEEMIHQSTRVMAEAYLTRDDYNYLYLDWNELSDGDFFEHAFLNIPRFGPEMASIILNWFKNGLNVDSFNLVCHSLGGQLCGMIGRSVYNKSNGETQIARISALDPALPGFFPAFGPQPVNKNDAKFVDIIHTDSWVYGMPTSIGHADFHPNSGKYRQPGCPKSDAHLAVTDHDLASHRRSWWFWADSVIEPVKTAFHSAKAKSWGDFKKGRYDETSIVNMGNDCPPTARGDYYLQTNGLRPYSRGVDGLKYVEEKYDPNLTYIGEETPRTRPVGVRLSVYLAQQAAEKSGGQ